MRELARRVVRAVALTPLALVLLGAVAASSEPTSDGTVNVFLTALKGRDFAAAESHFDGNLKAALPQDRLGPVWDSETKELGVLDSWKIIERTHAQGVDVRLAILEFERGDLQMMLSLNPGSHELVGLFFRSLPKPTTAPYANGAKFRDEEVSVGVEPNRLKGILSVPTGKGPFPAVVLVHGSGPHDKDETIGPNKPFKDIAEGLSSRGIVVLRYDKRTFQYRRQVDASISLDAEVVDDAVAAVTFLQGRPQVDARRVFVLGHSLGALLAPEIAVRSKGVAGVILLAPPGRTPWDAVLDQMRYLDAPADELAQVEKAVALLKAGKLGDGKLLGAPASYWKDWASRDGIAMAKKLGKPMLILRGERDYQVTEADIETWRTGLRGVADVEITILPGDNHLFIPGTGKPGPAEYYGAPGHVDERVIELLVPFITGKGPP